MKHPLLALGGGMFVAVVLASAGNRVDSISGPGTATQSVRFGTNTAAAYVGEVLAVPGAVMREAAPEIQNTMGQASGILGSTGTTAAPAAPPITAPNGTLNGAAGQ